jgi:hypothetical protein
MKFNNTVDTSSGFYEISLADTTSYTNPGGKPQYVLKIPIATIGEWYHQLYGKLTFTEANLQEIQRNFENQELSFSPSLHIGHPESEKNPSEGILFKVELENNILFGHWEVNKEIYRSVQDKQYRYSSAEFTLDLMSKRQANQSLGMALLRMALTNSPFMALPEVVTLSDYSNTRVTLSNNINNEELNMTTSNTLEPLTKAVEGYTQKTAALATKEVELQLSQLNSQVVALSQELEKYKAYETQLQESISQNEQLVGIVETYENQIRESKRDNHLKFIQTLAAAEPVKLKFSQLITDGTLGDKEDLVLEALGSLGTVANASPATRNPLLFTQQGVSLSTHQADESNFEANPYAARIALNRAVIEKRDANRLS